jgi:phage shock protein PspC (stress-responsive transcriptional regulator)/disulfide bond formation protein DsbB
MVGGVCRGLGEYFDVDPVVFRVLLAVLAFFGGTGIAAYAIAWLLIPDEGSPTTKVETWLRGRRGGRRRDAMIVVIALIAVALFANGYVFANRFGDAILVVALVLVVAAATGQIFGSNTARPRTWSPTGPPTGSPTGSPSEAPTQESTWSPTGSGATWAPPAKALRRTRSWLGLLTVGATMLTAGVLGIIAATGVAHPQPADVLAACVGVVGLGLVVGSLIGRSWLLIPVGLLLVACLAATDALPRNLTWTGGERTWTPVGTTVARSYVVGAGDATLDLTKLTPGQKLTIASSTGAGELLVVVPRGSAVDLTAHVGAGRIDALGHRSSGPGVMQQVNVAGSATPPLTLTLDLHVGFGEVVVRDAAA